jgi:hypothetical protein
MLISDFCEELNICINNEDYVSANELLMQETGKQLVNNKKDFVDLLNESSIPASLNDSDIELIEKFVENIPINQKLMLGTSLLVNMKNKQSSFDGSMELSDDNVKNAYHTMRTYFIDEKYSNAVDPLTAALDLAARGTELSNTVIKGKQQKTGVGQQLASKREDAKQALIQSVITEKNARLQAEQKKQDNKLKQQKTIYIIGGSILALTIIGIIIYKVKKK